MNIKILVVLAVVIGSATQSLANASAETQATTNAMQESHDRAERLQYARAQGQEIAGKVNGPGKESMTYRALAFIVLSDLATWETMTNGEYMDAADAVQARLGPEVQKLSEHPDVKIAWDMYTTWTNQTTSAAEKEHARNKLEAAVRKFKFGHK